MNKIMSHNIGRSYDESSSDGSESSGNESQSSDDGSPKTRDFLRIDLISRMLGTYRKKSRVNKMIPMYHKMTHKTFLYSFDDSHRKIVEDCLTLSEDNDILMSSYILSGILDTFQKISSSLTILPVESAKEIHLVHPEIYVMCPVYYDRKSRNFYDTQIAVTGSVCYSEDPSSCAIRELAEELGIGCQELDQCAENMTYKNNKMAKTILTYALHIADSVPLCRANIQQYKSIPGKDNRKLKTQTVIYGKLNDLHTIIKKISYRLDSKDLTSIRGIRLMSFYDFMQYVESHCNL